MRPFDNPTAAAKEAIKLAHIQYTGLVDACGHEFVGTEHLLIGLLNVGDNAARRALQNAGFDLDTLSQRALDEAAERGGNAAPEDRAHNLLVIACDQANDLGHSSLGTEHLLMAILTRPESMAARLLAEYGPLDRLREEAVKAAGSDPTESA